MVVEIPLSKTGKNAGKYVAIVDDCDADLAELNWNVQTGHSTPYAKRKIYDDNGRAIAITLHRVIMERMLGYPIPKGMQVDHVNMDGIDNRRENLRIATKQQNVANQGKKKCNTSGYKGVSFNNGSWRATIFYNGKQIFIGRFNTPQEAYAAYCKKAFELHGEFANHAN